MTDEEFRRKQYGHKKYRNPPIRRYRKDAEDVLSWEKSFVGQQLATGTSNRRQAKAFEKIVRLAIEKELTPRQREIARLYYYEEHNCSEISWMLGLAPSSVSRTLHRAERKIRMHLKYCLLLLRISNEEDDDDI